MAPTHTPAPKRPRLRRGMVGLTLPPKALERIDAEVGGLLGSTRSEVLRFIVVSWLTDHAHIGSNRDAT